MKAYTLLRTLSIKLSAKHSSGAAVTPWPPERTSFDKWLELELDRLRLGASVNQCTTALWLAKALDVTVSSQKMLIRSISSQGGTIDTRIVNEYLDDSVQLLDACNGLRERIEVINRYIESINIALHWIEEGTDEHEPGEAAVRRARAALSSCEAVERRCLELDDKCGSKYLRKLGEKISKQVYVTREQSSDDHVSDEFNEAIIGSSALAVLVVSILGIAFSFKSRRGIPSIHLQKNSTNCWEKSFHELHKEVKEEFDKRRKGGVKAMVDLDATASAARQLREAIASSDRGGDLSSKAEMLKKASMELEQRIRPFQNKVNELFRAFVKIRMALLEMSTM